VITWDDVKNLEADLREQAALQAEETAAQARNRMNPQEQEADRAFARAKRQGERAEWAARWPQHCRSCEGAGAFTVQCGEEADGEPCEDCQGIMACCPRCGAVGVSIFQSWPCRGCGWTYGGPDAVMPSAEPIWRAECEEEWAARKAAGLSVDPFDNEREG